jgi:hypothetical protein
MSNIKIQSFCQISHLAIIYALEFKQLACDISWGEAMLMSQFQFGLRGDVKDLLVTLLDPLTLSQAIAQVIWCDNKLCECQQERHHEPTSTTERSFAPTTPAEPLATLPKDDPM